MLEGHTVQSKGRGAPPVSTPTRMSLGSRAEAVRRFARKCRYHEAHSEHVTTLALEIFDQLAELLPGVASRLAKGHPSHPLALDPMAAMDGEGRGVLEAAGVLHDIGYLVNHSKHHKHSYYIIANGELDGFSPRERELIANVARYHRRSPPKNSHEPYAAMDTHDRKIVRRLAGILRVADGLDRTHTQVVDRVALTIEARDSDGQPADHPNTAVFTIESPGDASTDVWGSQRKADLFCSAFGLRCAFEVG
jgi:exopolyphosphatase/guanosine-5'-triphosphate,3'-diphosphate pyrophosphatase